MKITRVKRVRPCDCEAWPFCQHASNAVPVLTLPVTPNKSRDRQKRESANIDVRTFAAGWIALTGEDATILREIIGRVNFGMEEYDNILSIVSDYGYSITTHGWDGKA